MATQQISASLQNPKGDVQTDTGRVNEPGYYVIVGSGVTALYNHFTLIDRAKKWGQPDSDFAPDTDWGTQRLSAEKSGGDKRLPVMHIGFPEPWQRRRGERMGQWPRMLNFFRGMGDGFLGLENASGYSTSEGFQKDWLPSAVFANGLNNVRTYIDAQYKYADVRLNHASYLVRGSAPIPAMIVWESGFVGVIEKQDNILVRDDSFGSTADSADSWEKRLWDKVTKYWAGNRVWSDGKPNADFQRNWKNTACPYRITVYCQIDEGREALRMRYVYAHKIDICTGPGQPRTFAKGNFLTTTQMTKEDLWEKHLPEWATPPHWRSRSRTKLIDGNEYIGYGNRQSETAIVFKGNPIGAQSVQSALDMPEMRDSLRVGRVWFISNKDLRKDEANVPGDRNLLEVVGDSQPPDGPKRVNENLRITRNHGDQWADQAYRARMLGNRLFRVSSHEIDKISATETGIRCTFTLQGRNPIPPADAENAVIELLASCADPPGCEVTGGVGARKVARIDGSFLVYSQGQDRTVTSCGSVAFMTRRLTDLAPVFDSRTGFPFTVTDGAKDKEVDGLDTRETAPTGGVRILGSGIMTCCAAWTNAEGNKHFDAKDFPTRDEADGSEVAAANNPTKSQAGSIPREGPAGGGGLNLNIPNIWRANRHFGKGLASINTASVFELQDAGLTEIMAKWIVAVRSITDRGYSWDEYMGKLREIEQLSLTQRSQLGIIGVDTGALINPERFKF
jgi:hypothetical protein